ncbi:MAG: FAD:protein FMN transferase [Planctomycetes bacterium]|nr:FAD:protein FMN transferase [Planctomycetota bacterium]
MDNLTIITRVAPDGFIFGGLFEGTGMSRLGVIFVGAWMLASLGACSADLQRYEYTHPQMGTLFRVVFYDSNVTHANKAAAAAFDRIDDLNNILSDYAPGSELSRLSATAGSDHWVPVSQDLWNVLSVSQQVAYRSGGAFDVSVGPVIRLWRQARIAGRLPDPPRLEAAMAAVGWQKVKLDPQRRSVQLAVPHMRLDLGGIAKGYALAQSMKVLSDRGITRAMIVGGGSVYVTDPPPHRNGWRIALMPIPQLTKPVEDTGADAKPESHDDIPYLLAANTSVATSGDAFQHIDIDGVRYSHIVDPHTGLGLTTQTGVTVICPDPTLADAMSTALSVLPLDRALQLADDTPALAALIITHTDQGDTTHTSTRYLNLPLDTLPTP